MYAVYACDESVVRTSEAASRCFLISEMLFAHAEISGIALHQSSTWAAHRVTGVGDMCGVGHALVMQIVTFSTGLVRLR